MDPQPVVQNKSTSKFEDQDKKEVVAEKVVIAKKIETPKVVKEKVKE